MGAIVLFAALIGGGAFASAPPDLEREVIDGLALRDAAFRNIAGRITIRDHQRVLRQGPFRDRVQVIDAIIDADARARIELLESPPSGPEGGAGAKPIRLIEATGGAGEGSKQLERAVEDEEQSIGHIRKHQALSWAIHPFIILHFQAYSPARLWQVAKPSVAEGEVIGGLRTVKVSWESASDNPPGSRLRGSYWLAPGFGHAPVRAVAERRPSPEMEWKEISRIESEGYRRVRDLWLPQKASLILHHYYDAGHHELGQELEFTFENWSANQALPEGIFELAFPDKSIISDEVKGGPSYIKRRIDDAMLDRQAERAERLIASGRSSDPEDLQSSFRDAMAQAPGGRRSWRLALEIGAITLSFLASLIAWSWYRRRGL